MHHRGRAIHRRDEHPGGYSTQSCVSNVKLIEKAVAVNLHTAVLSGHTSIPHHIEVVYKIAPFPRWLQ